MLFHSSYAFDAYPSTYLIGPDGRVRAAWSGYRQRDEADMARAVVAALKDVTTVEPNTRSEDVSRSGNATEPGTVAPPEAAVTDTVPREPVVEPRVPAAR